MDKINIFDFISYVKNNKDQFINYCEVILDYYGNVIMAIPSHQETVVEIAYTKENKTREQFLLSIPMHCSPLHWCIDKYNLVAVWHNGYIYGEKVNRFQERSIKILEKNGLLKPEWAIQTDEYKKYLYRKSIGYED